MFLKNIDNIKKFTTSKELLLFCLKNTSEKGLYLEFGVYTGNTINIISQNKQDQIIYGFDSFEGLPEDWRNSPNDPLKYLKGAFNINGNLPKVNNNVKLLKGWFSDTIPIFLKENKIQEKISFLHIDCDLYSSTKCIFDNLGIFLKKDTIILFDEFYNYLNWEQHEYKAWSEFIELNPNIKFEYIGINVNHEQVAVRIVDV
jgi:hypothetical protein